MVVANHPLPTVEPEVAVATLDENWGWLVCPTKGFRGWCDHPWPSTMADRPPIGVVGQPLWGLVLIFFIFYFYFFIFFIKKDLKENKK
jgi:hypothetical protein